MSNGDTVRDIYAAFGRGDVPAMLGRMAEDVVWEQHMTDGYGIPWMRPGRGVANVRAFFETVGRELELQRFETTNVLEGGSQVVALIRLEARVRATGRLIEDFEGHVWTFDAAGKVQAFRHLVDTHQHWKAAGRG